MSRLVTALLNIFRQLPSSSKRRSAIPVSLVLLGCAACAQVSSGHMLDETVAPGANYDKADFRLWYPDSAKFLRAVVVLVPGSNADGRSDVGDRFWQTFASRNDVALIGCRFTDKPHEEAFVENYANAAQGSGQALLDALTAFSGRSDHPELANAPLLLWGMSAGGQFNYEFTAWKPERVVAFVVNKGGIYFSALLPAAARRVPGLLFVGDEDLDFAQAHHRRPIRVKSQSGGAMGSCRGAERWTRGRAVAGNGGNIFRCGPASASWRSRERRILRTIEGA